MRRPELPRGGSGWQPSYLIRFVGGTKERMVAKAFGEGSKRTTEPFRVRFLR